ncbi:MAG: 50S ribosomal protein L10 [Fusobacteria bacterium]|nr:MAG: 50S ribosomal protein L10 [Fusobacteriota bacterium]
MATEQKKLAVVELTQKIKDAKTIVLVDYQGINAKEDTEIKKQLRETGSEYLVAKNRLFKIALQEAGVEDSFDDLLEGTTAFAFGYEDAVAPAKVVYEFGKTKGKDLFNIKGGYSEGKRVDISEIEALATLPSRDALLSMILNGMLGPIRKLAYGVVAIADKKEEA